MGIIWDSLVLRKVCHSVFSHKIGKCLNLKFWMNSFLYSKVNKKTEKTIGGSKLGVSICWCILFV